MAKSIIVLLMLATLGGAGKVSAGDWPGHLGPNRNGVAAEDERVATNLSTTPNIEWEIVASGGYAGAAISDNQVCLYDHVDNQDRLRMVSLDSGTAIWEKRFPSSYTGGMDSDRGPRCVPTILAKAIVLYSAAGELSLVNREDGEILWSRAIRKEYGADDGYFGAGSTPLVVGDLIIVNIGSKSAAVVAVSLQDGKTVWTAGNAEASYASPIMVSVAGEPRILVPSKVKTTLIDPSNGKLMSEIKFGARGPAVVAATPIAIDDGKYYLTSSYGGGSLVVDFLNGSLVEASRNSFINSQYTTPVYSNGLLFGCDGREDGGDSSFVCLETKNSKVKWTQSPMPVCHALRIDKSILIVGINGLIWAIADDASKWEPNWSMTLPTGNYRPLPAISRGLLVTRSIGPQSKWLAIRIDR